MRKFSLVAAALAAGMAFGSGAYAQTDLEKAVKDGFKALSVKETAEWKPGKKIRGDGWKMTYQQVSAKEGKKVIETNKGKSEKKWWINDKGEFCEENFTAGLGTTCDQVIAIKGDEIIGFDGKGKQTAKFKLDK